MNQHQPLAILFSAGLNPPALVLDIGCGTGLHARGLAGAGFRVIAADMDCDALVTAREMEEDDAPRSEYVAARAEALPWRDGVFDAVVCFDVLHWAADAAACAAMRDEAWRVLKPGGLFLARSLLRDFLPTAAPRGDGLFRLDSGATWFLPTRADLDALLRAGSGAWLMSPMSPMLPMPPEPGDAGAALMLARKNA